MKVLVHMVKGKLPDQELEVSGTSLIKLPSPIVGHSAFLTRSLPLVTVYVSVSVCVYVCLLAFVGQ